PASPPCSNVSPVCCRSTPARCGGTAGISPGGTDPRSCSMFRTALRRGRLNPSAGRSTTRSGSSAAGPTFATKSWSNSGWRPSPRQPVGPPPKGDRKGVLLGIGLLPPQPALLIDEPLDGLDLRQSREVSAALRAHAAGGRTLFLSIHQIGDAARFCDRFV